MYYSLLVEVEKLKESRR